MDTKIQPLNDQVKRGWQVTIDGQPVEVKEMLQLTHSKYGQLTYGKSPGGNYDQWAFHEAGGGGSVIAPFVKIKGKLYVGVVLQSRPLQSDEPVVNVPRGFLEPGQTHFQAASAELAEEMGIKDFPIIDLGGEGGNPNSAFFETWGENEGVHFWAVHFPEKALVVQGYRQYGIKPDVVQPVKGDKMAELILGSSFIPWVDIARLGDMMGKSAVALLQAYLLGW